MQFESMPILKMQIEGLKTTIMSHLGVVGSELGEALSEEVNKAVASYDWEGQVKAIVHNTLNQKIESYFRWGGAARSCRTKM